MVQNGLTPEKRTSTEDKKIENLLGFRKFYRRFMQAYGREGYIDSNYNTAAMDDPAPYFSPIKTASVIKLRQSRRGRSEVDLEKEPQMKSPDHIPKSAVLEKSPGRGDFSRTTKSRQLKESEPFPRKGLAAKMAFADTVNKNDLLSHEVSFSPQQNETSNYALSSRNNGTGAMDPGNVVVFDKRHMKQFLLGVWDQMGTHLGTISSLQRKLDQTIETRNQARLFQKKGEVNSYGVPVYEKKRSRKKRVSPNLTSRVSQEKNQKTSAENCSRSRNTCASHPRQTRVEKD